MSTLGERFRQQADACPDAVAVVAGDTVLTYAQLCRRAERVAEGLRRRGVDWETPVGVVFPRSVEAIVAIVGVVLAGGAYVPVNPSFPAARVSELLADSGAPVTIHAPAVDVAAPPSTTTVTLAELEECPAAGPPPAPGRPPLAAVMYTSGSTGRPKGVLIEHRGILRLVVDTDYAPFGPAERFLQMSALEFDAAFLEIWGALLHGARLSVADRETVMVPWRLALALREQRITFLWVTSALFNQLADEDPGMFAGLRTLMTGGDVLSPRHVAAVRRHCPRVRLVNGYGPTENTTFTTAHPITADVAPVPIGRAIPGTTTVVLDAGLRPVPRGTVGELVTGGAGVARGYLNRPELTRERFVEIDGQWCHRTGDLVHEDADGVLHFHGRTDAQVKVRGHRIELGEVLAALREVHGVHDAHVTVSGAGADKQLVAYVVAPGTPVDRVRADLAARLPAYTLPDRIVRLAALPLNANGKVDARALPAAGDPPAGPVRHDGETGRLAELWAEVLRVEPATISSTASFFDLGGDSIKLGAVLGRVERLLGARVPIDEVFAAPTLITMAAAVTRARHAPAADLPDVPAGTAVALHPRQLFLYALWQAAPDSVVYNVPLRVTLRGRLDELRLARALQAVLDRHDALRMRFGLTAEGVRQTPVDGLTVRIEGPQEPAFVRPFRLDEPPLLRARLVPAGDDLHELHLDLPHIAVDGISLRTLLGDLLRSYAGAPLPRPPVTYAAAAQWHHENQVSASHEQYWLREIAELPAGGDLPVDHPRGDRRAEAGAVARRVLDRARTAAVARTARRERVTPAVVLLTAWVAALVRLTRQQDLVVGTAMSGRTHPATGDVVGMFVNTVCLRARTAETPDLSALCRSLAVRQARAMAHQEYPFEHLVRRSGRQWPANRHPVFDAFFAYQDLECYELAAGELSASTEMLPAGTTRFDLNMQVHRRPDRMVVDLEYACELFDPATAGHLLDLWSTAVTELITAPRTLVVTPVATAAQNADFIF